MSAPFRLSRQVEFNHCDPAGIVFYPRYFEMISATVERFFADGLGYSWARMGLSDGYGVPMGSIEARFHAPSRLEDWLDFDLTVIDIGQASLKVHVTGSCAGDPRFDCHATLVNADLRDGASAPWPAPARAAMAAFMTASNTNTARKTNA